MTTGRINQVAAILMTTAFL